MSHAVLGVWKENQVRGCLAIPTLRRCSRTLRMIAGDPPAVRDGANVEMEKLRTLIPYVVSGPSAYIPDESRRSVSVLVQSGRAEH